MAIFPALVPSSRTFTPGEYPATAFNGYSGAQNRVRHSNVFLAGQLRLSFLGLTQAQMLDIWNHYNGRRGEFRSFELPAEVVSYGSITDYVPGTYLWRYSGPGSVEDLPCGGHNVSLTLETVPPTSASVVGAQLFVSLRLITGAADGGEYVPGIGESVTLSLTSGSAFSAIDGLNQSISISIEPGGAIGDGLANGIDEIVSLLFQPGMAKEYLAGGISETITLGLVAGVAEGDLVDPDFASVGLLLHMDGSNGSTTFTDNSSNNLTVSVFGNAQVSTSNPKFGSGSLLLDGTGDYLEVPDDPDWDFGTGNYTVEAWIYLSSTAVFAAPIVGRGTTSALRSWGVRFLGSASGSTRLSWYRPTQTAVFVNWSPSVNTWYHVAACRSGTSLRFFVDGSQVGSTATDNQDYDARAYAVRVGYDGTNFFPGQIDEVRVTKGVARYTANFTPPTAPFPDS